VKIVVFLNQLGLGGSEKAACRWAKGLAERGHTVHVLSLKDGPRRSELDANRIEVRTVADANTIRKQLDDLRPDVIHAHAPGHPHEGDILGEALALMPKIPVAQTNIFGHLDNLKEDAWTDFRLFVSWTSCVQAARRTFQALNKEFFRHNSIAVYPLDADDGPSSVKAEEFRSDLGIQRDDVVFGRLSRGEPNKWTDLAINGFRMAARHNPRLKLLLREPPRAVAQTLAIAPDRDRFVILPATSNQAELALTTASLDVVLHTSSVGESFGYGIAEPMNYGKPVIANSTPWQDQAQIELVRHGECGFIASTPKAIAGVILKLASNTELRARLGRNAQAHIRKLADPGESTNRLEAALQSAVTGRNNPHASEDLARAQTAADYLDKHQFGHSFSEQIALRPFHYRVLFHQWRKTIRRRTSASALNSKV
jgi:glycosyltransferase involved in cell wall biosynthesis